MEKRPLYTIGYGNRTPEDFLAILKDFGIEYLIDIRSQPYSKFNSQFSQNELKFFLEKSGVRYVFMGDNIGGRPKDASCYDDEGKADYGIIKTKDFFIEGIERLRKAYDKDIGVIIMCSEGKPSECHRSKLIGVVLEEENISVRHIDENGKIKDQITVINELNKGLSTIDLFGNSSNLTSRKSYL